MGPIVWGVRTGYCTIERQADENKSDPVSNQALTSPSSHNKSPRLLWMLEAGCEVMQAHFGEGVVAVRDCWQSNLFCLVEGCVERDGAFGHLLPV